MQLQEKIIKNFSVNLPDNETENKYHQELKEFFKEAEGTITKDIFVPEVGYLCSGLLCSLISFYFYWKERNKTVSGEWFYLNHYSWNVLCRKFGLQTRTIQKKLQLLEQKGFIQSKRTGCNGRKYIHITQKTLLLLKNSNKNSTLSHNEIFMDKPSVCHKQTNRFVTNRGTGSSVRDADIINISTKTNKDKSETNEYKKDAFPLTDVKGKGGVAPSSPPLDNIRSLPEKADKQTVPQNKSINRPFRRRQKALRPIPKDAVAPPPAPDKPDAVAQVPDNDAAPDKPEMPKPSPVISKLVAYWNSLDNVTRHKTKRMTKIYARCIQYLEQLMDGTFFDDKEGFEELAGRKFTQDEILWAMRSYSQSPDAEHRRRGLDEFIWNGRSKVKRFKSLFADCFLLPDDPHEVLTKAIKRAYIKEFRGIDGEFTKYDEIKFMKAAARLSRFIKAHRKDLVIAKPKPKTAAKWLIDAVANEFRGNDLEKSVVTPGWLCSDKTFAHRLPNYLFAQAMVKERGVR